MDEYRCFTEIIFYLFFHQTIEMKMIYFTAWICKISRIINENLHQVISIQKMFQL